MQTTNSSTGNTVLTGDAFNKAKDEASKAAIGHSPVPPATQVGKVPLAGGKPAKAAKPKAPRKAKAPKAKLGNVVPKQYREQYGKLGNCGDALAKALVAFLAVASDAETRRAKLVELGKANDVDVLKLWGARNNGMVRMNLGNVLRGRLGERKVVVPGIRTWEAPKAKAEAQAS